MTSVSRLKDKAREHERKEDWRKAIDAYLQVINKSEAGGSDAELSLYNRVGDLFLRIGEDRSAVDYYERAAERYGESGLYNNAIALCNKALRYEPGRVDLYRRLGQLSAEQGFVTDARRWYLEYAERLMKAGRPDDAFHALEEFAALSEDAEVREVLATQLVTRGETEKAVTQLRLAYSARLEAGETAEADAVRERLTELAPQLEDEELGLDVGDHVPDGEEDGPPLPQLHGTGAAEETGAVGDETPAQDTEDVDAADLELDEFESDETEAVAVPEGFDAGELETGELEVEDVEAPEVPGLIATDMGADASLDEEEADEDVEPLPTLDDPFETTDEAEAIELERPDDESLEDVEPLPGFESAGAEGQEYEPEATGTLDGLDTFEPETEPDTEAVEELPGFEEPDEVQAAEEELPGFEEAGEREAAEEELPGFEEAGEREAAEEELPGFEEAEEEAAWAAEEPVAEAPAAESVTEAPTAREPAAPEPAAPEPVVSEAGAAASADAELTEAIEDAIVRFRTGDEAAALRELERLHAGLAEEGRVRDARRAADAAVELDPDSLPTHQHRVEYAFRAGDRRELVAAYLDFAAALRRGGMGDKAQSVYRRVLEIEPSNRTAQAALTPPSEPAAPAGGDFVDLGSMLLDDSEATTRFRVAETHESGDEERDFEEMLSQFRAKVAEHVSEEDTESHYDLGLAFKEMGLVDEAIAEFQTAMRGGDERLKVYEELGQCFMLKEQYGIAAKLLSRAAQLPASDERELIGVYYQMGRCYEELGRAGDAREAYERVLGLDIDFRDVSDRMRSL